MSAPFDTIRKATLADTPPPAPGPWAQADPVPMSTFSPAPTVTEDPIAQNIQNDQEELRKVRYAQTHPWGTPENHPGKLGKLAHIFSEVGNIAGNIVAPNVMANIDGTQMGMRAKESRLAGRLNEELGQKSLEQQQEATAGHLNEETAEMPANSESNRKLQGAQAGHLNEQTEKLEHPNPEYSTTPFLTPEGNPVAMEKNTGGFETGEVGGLRYGRMNSRLQHVAGTVNGVPTQANFDPIQGIYTSPDTGQQILGFKPMPQPGMMGPVVVAPDTGKVMRATPGTTLPEGFRTVNQQGSINSPTQQMRNAGARAELAVQEIPGIISEVSRLGNQLGPVSGRWNEYMQGKVGADNPELAGLRSDLIFLSSAVALAHAVGRLPENLRQEFDHMINAPQQTPQNLISTLNHVQTWMQQNRDIMQMKPGENPAQAPPAGPPAGAKVRDYTQLGGK